jgi:hypothetical protein
MGLLALTLCVGAARAEDFGLQIAPRWSERGELSIALTNYSKLSIETRGVSAQLGAADDRACRWRALGTIALKPVETKVVTLASTRGVRRCLDRLPNTRGVETRSLRFATSSEVAASARLESVKIHVDVRRRNARGEANADLALTRIGGAP